MTARDGYHWTTEEIEGASRMWKEGKSGTDIANAFGRTRSAASGMINRNRDLFPPRSGATHRSRVARATGKTKAAGTRAARQQTANRAASGGIIDDLIDKANAREPEAEPAAPFRENRRPVFARPITCQDVARNAPIETIMKAVRRGDLPEDAKPTPFDDLDTCQCCWPVGPYRQNAIGWRPEQACGAPVIDTASKFSMARTHCAFHFRAMGQNLDKVLAR